MKILFRVKSVVTACFIFLCLFFSTITVAKIGKKNGGLNRSPCKFRSQNLFLLLLVTVSVTVHELVDTSCCINQFLLTGVERMRCAGD